MFDAEFRLVGDPIEAEVGRLYKAGTFATRATARRGRTLLRAQIRRSFKRGGKGLQKAVQVSSSPRRGVSPEPVSQVVSKATYRRRRGQINILEGFDRPTTIRAQFGRYLALPTKDAPIDKIKGGATRKHRPKTLGRKLQFKPAGRGRAVLVDPRSGKVLFVLVRQVRLRRRVDIDKAFAEAAAQFDENFGKALDRLR